MPESKAAERVMSGRTRQGRHPAVGARPSPSGRAPANLPLGAHSSSPPTRSAVCCSAAIASRRRCRVLLGDLVPGLGPGRIDDPGDVTTAGQHVADFPTEQVGGFVRRGPRHDVVVDGADHVRVARDVAQLQTAPVQLELDLAPAGSRRRGSAGRTRAELAGIRVLSAFHDQDVERGGRLTEKPVRDHVVEDQLVGPQHIERASHLLAVEEARCAPSASPAEPPTASSVKTPSAPGSR